ncbi:hypothetical protein IFM47457_00259 [Aspergillus lentulus]|nr:hypothetical protein IFM47457_00259 [Aspergillus lentulus]
MMQNDRSLDRRTTRVQYLPPPKGEGPSCTLRLEVAIPTVRLKFTSHKVDVPTSLTNTAPAAALTCPHLQAYLKWQEIHNSRFRNLGLTALAHHSLVPSLTANSGWLTTMELMDRFV